MLTERLQVLIEREQRERLEALAGERGASVATLVREAIDRTFPPTTQRRRSAAKSILAAQPMSAPDPDDLRNELDDLRARHA